jgi:hypothetical protein
MNSQRLLIVACVLSFQVVPCSAGELLLPVFAHNVRGAQGSMWSSEIYLTNPGQQPVQVTLSDFLPGTVHRPTPCDLFMPPTRVVPPRSSVVWTASGLATDLGCAETALGGLVLGADGEIDVSSRTVNHGEPDQQPFHGLLVGPGQQFHAVPVAALPRPGRYLVPALMWHRNPCGEIAFESSIGFANPGPYGVTIVLELAPDLAEGGAFLDGKEVEFPHSFRMKARSWRQIELGPRDLPGDICMDPESFAAIVTIDRPLAIFASVVDRSSQDPRTMMPVALE